jgi:hypothetical protein
MLHFIYLASVSFLSCPRIRLLHHTESLHQPGQPVAAAALSDMTEGTNVHCNISNSVSENVRSCLNFLAVTPYGLVNNYSLPEERQCVHLQGTVNTKVSRYLRQWGIQGFDTV